MHVIDTVLIVGGGIAGMTSAIRFAEAGVKVEIVDLDPEWRVYGAGITITGPTLRAYKRLGLLEAIKTQGAITTGSALFRFDGIHLKDLDEPAIEEGLPATGGIMRPVLHRIMQARVKELNITVRLGQTVSELKNDGDGVNVTFSDNSTGRYDLVIGADSINSHVRKLAFPAMGEAEYTGQGCWRISMRKPPMLEKGEMYFGHRYPCGITRCGEDAVYLWQLTPHVRREKHFDDDELFENMRANLEGFGNSAGWIRDNMARTDWINYRPLAAAIQPGPWHIGRIVLVGDAVHATTPHLASGAGMAVEGAMVLADELSKAVDVETGLTAYYQRRIDRCRDVVETSIAVGKLQLEGGSAEQVGGMIGGALHRLAGDF